MHPFGIQMGSRPHITLFHVLVRVWPLFRGCQISCWCYFLSMCTYSDSFGFVHLTQIENFGGLIVYHLVYPIKPCFIYLYIWTVSLACMLLPCFARSTEHLVFMLTARKKTSLGKHSNNTHAVLLKHCTPLHVPIGISNPLQRERQVDGFFEQAGVPSRRLHSRIHV